MGKYNVIFVHGPKCNDGIMCAVVAKMAQPDIQVVVVSDRQNLPDEILWKNKDVLIADFSYSRELLQKMNNGAKTLLVLDHHYSAEKDLGDLSYCTFCMDKSGCQMVWDHFFPNVNQPLLVKIIGESDRGKNTLPETTPVLDYSYCLPYEINAWRLFMDELETDPSRIIEAGKLISPWKNNVIKNMVNSAFQTKLAGQIVWCLNASVFKNEAANILMTKSKFAIVFNGNEGKWYWSLRSNKIDLTEIAEKFGGGGHQGAAAFTVDYAPSPIPNSKKWRDVQ